MMSETLSSAPAPSAEKLPRRFGRYLLFDFVGRGGMAEIYLARMTTDFGGSRLVVVKQIAHMLAQESEFAQMLIHEAKLAAQLNHANIVQVFDLGREADELYIAMEFVEGFDLNALLRRCSKSRVPFPFEFALYAVTCTAAALDYAHRRTDEAGKPLGIVHRDVSPSNVLISFDGDVKLCDFGIAHANVHAEGAQFEEALKGKAGYMSPEHARGEAVDARSDVFGVGIILWEMIAGHRLYRPGDDRESVLELARRAEVPELPERQLRGMDELTRIVKRALAPQPSDRYPTAAALLRELESYARSAQYVASPLRFGEWLVESFGTDIATRRRMRERAAAALDHGPPVELRPIVSPAAAPSSDVRADAEGGADTESAAEKVDERRPANAASAAARDDDSPGEAESAVSPSEPSANPERGAQEARAPAHRARAPRPSASRASLVGTSIDLDADDDPPETITGEPTAGSRWWVWLLASMVAFAVAYVAKGC